MKIDDSNFERLDLNGKIDPFWYDMGRKTYLGENATIEPSNNLSRIQLLSYRKGILDAARTLGDLEREDYYSESAFRYFDQDAKERQAARMKQ